MTNDRVSSVMVVDDEPGIRTALRANFLRHGWRVEVAGSVREAISHLEGKEFDLVVTDIRMPDGTGMEVMRATRRLSPGTAVILLTAYGSVPDAVSAMRDGALDYLTKPISFDQLQATAAKVMQVARQAPVEDDSLASGIIGRSPLLLRALQRARSAASTNADVLVEAESGTGKELLARFIHDSSDRRGKPFVALNCAAVPESLLESELFGHARGAFTGAVSAKPGKFELADGGTILLDEIGEMPLHLQPKLLRALQEREFERLGEARSVHVDIRVIATTNVSLAAMVERGQFRSDLFYRLNVIPLSLPPLRDRKEDIPALAKYFAEKHAAQSQTRAPQLRQEFLDRLQTHAWPGNVRELANFMRRVVTLSDTQDIDARCFDREFQIVARSSSSWPSLAPVQSPAVLAGTPIRELERLHVENTLALTDGNRTHAAVMLGISLRTLRNRIREYGLPPRRIA
ncbi:MAG TPA: sigma-54 dependent transcriptional regulator [Acidobacteriaceae bacterium]|nr:sigma-54 dependent transcriptional regulator [Acidobacteriaceae bacterium]